MTYWVWKWKKLNCVPLYTVLSHLVSCHSHIMWTDIHVCVCVFGFLWSCELAGQPSTTWSVDQFPVAAAETTHSICMEAASRLNMMTVSGLLSNTVERHLRVTRNLKSALTVRSPGSGLVWCPWFQSGLVALRALTALCPTIRSSDFSINEANFWNKKQEKSCFCQCRFLTLTLTKVELFKVIRGNWTHWVIWCVMDSAQTNSSCLPELLLQSKQLDVLSSVCALCLTGVSQRLS